MPPRKKTPAKKATAKKKATKAVAVVEETPLATAAAYEEMAGEGQENVTVDDVSIPFLGLVQSMSPQRKKNNAKYIDGAEEGDLFNTVTCELFTAPVRVIPCFFKKQFIQWVPRDSGGGFRGAFSRTDDIVSQTPQNEKGVRVLDNGDELIETATHYVLMWNDNTESWEPIVMSLSSTMLKMSRKWMTIIKNRKMKGGNGVFNPPSFAYEYSIGVATDSNDKGEWYLFTVESGKVQTDPEVAAQARHFHDLVNSGEVAEDHTKSQRGDEMEPDSDNY